MFSKEEIPTEKDPREGFAEFNYMQVTRNLWHDKYYWWIYKKLVE